MIEGFFRIAFTGVAGSGFGVLVLHAGSIAGADVAGALFDGTYTEDQDGAQLTVQVNMLAPAGVALVQTGIPLAAATTLPITATLAEDDILRERPVLVQTPLGPVNVIFKKIRDLP